MFLVRSVPSTRRRDVYNLYTPTKTLGNSIITEKLRVAFQTTLTVRNTLQLIDLTSQTIDLISQNSRMITLRQTIKNITPKHTIYHGTKLSLPTSIT